MISRDLFNYFISTQSANITHLMCLLELLLQAQKANIFLNVKIQIESFLIIIFSLHGGL